MKFEIQSYLDSLHEDVGYINISNHNLTFIPCLKRFKKLQELNCSYNKLVSLPSLNDNLRILKCANNMLTSLPSLNDNLRKLDCANNNLTSLSS